LIKNNLGLFKRKKNMFLILVANKREIFNRAMLIWVKISIILLKFQDKITCYYSDLNVRP